MNTVDEKIPLTLGDRGRSQNLRVRYEALVVFSRILGFLSNEETRTARKWQLEYGSDAPQYSAQVPASWIKSDKNFSLSKLPPSRSLKSRAHEFLEFRRLVVQ